MKHQTGRLGCWVVTYLTIVPDCRRSGVTKTIFPIVAFKVMHRVILLIRFWKLLTTVTILSGGGGTCLKCLSGTTPLIISRWLPTACPLTLLFMPRWTIIWSVWEYRQQLVLYMLLSLLAIGVTDHSAMRELRPSVGPAFNPQPHYVAFCACIYWHN